MKHALWIICGIAVAAVLGCGFEEMPIPSIDTSPTVEKKLDRPEETFATAAAALREDDVRTFAECLTDETVDTLAGTVASIAIVAKNIRQAFGEGRDPEVRRLSKTLVKHGLDHETVQHVMSQSGTMMHPETAFHGLIEPVKDRKKFLADVYDALHDTPDAPEKPLSKDARLDGLRIEGDIAHATVVQTRYGKLRRDSIEFRKINGHWLIHAPDGLGGLGSGVEELP